MTDYYKQFDYRIKTPCPGCGAEVDLSAESCPKCGRQVKGEAPDQQRMRDMAEERLVCSACSEPIGDGDEYWVAAKKKGKTDVVLCSKCHNSAETALEEETKNPKLGLALALGGLAAVVSALIWYGIVVATGWMFGFIAILAGWLVAKGVVWGAGGKRGPALQGLSILLTIVSILLAEYLAIVHIADMGFLSISEFFTLYGASFSGEHVIVREYEVWFEETAGFMQFAFYAIALWEAFRLPARRTLKGQYRRQVCLP